MVASSIYIVRRKAKTKSFKIACTIFVSVEAYIFLQCCLSFFGVSVTKQMSRIAYKQQKFIAHSSGWGWSKIKLLGDLQPHKGSSCAFLHLSIGNGRIR